MPLNSFQFISTWYLCSLAEKYKGTVDSTFDYRSQTVLLFWHYELQYDHNNVGKKAGVCKDCKDFYKINFYYKKLVYGLSDRQCLAGGY